MAPLSHYLAVSAILFVIGASGVLFRRNAIIIFIPLFVLAPLAAFAFNTFFGSRLKGQTAGWIATIAVFISFFITAGVFFEMMGRAPEERPIHYVIADWIHVGRIQVNIAYLID